MSGIVYNGNTGYSFKINGVTPDVYYNGNKIWPVQTAALESYKLSFPVSNNIASWGVYYCIRTKDYASIPVTATSGILTTGTTVSALSTATLGAIFTGTSGWMSHNAGTLDLYIKPAAVNQELIYSGYSARDSQHDYWPQSAYYYNHYSDNSNVLKGTWTESQISSWGPVVFSFNVYNS